MSGNISGNILGTVGTNIKEVIFIYCVYMHRCKANDRRYIGITSQAPEQRWDYGWGYKNNIRFFKDIRKHGWDNFEHEIIHGWLTEEQAKVAKIALIKKYNTQNPQKGYNAPKKIIEVCKVSKQGKLICSYFGEKDFISNESINYGTVRRACNQGGGNVKGFFWCYRQDAEKYSLI